MEEWKIVTQETILNTKWMSIRQDTCILPSGRIIDDFFVIERNDFVTIFALTDKRQVILVRQYRHAIGETTFEIPGGDCGPGESPRETAQRELIEETGYGSDDLQHIATLVVDPTRQNNRVHVFIALHASPVDGYVRPNEIQDLHVELLPLNEVLALIDSGQLCALDSVATILIACHYLKP
jgi:ADP-ribose pyrophosphatase